jgi:hypothetical protein
MSSSSSSFPRIRLSIPPKISEGRNANGIITLASTGLFDHNFSVTSTNPNKI